MRMTLKQPCSVLFLNVVDDGAVNIYHVMGMTLKPLALYCSLMSR